MKRIIYAGSEFLTGDEIASAVLQLGAALADAADAEMVEIPIVESDGSQGTVLILLGPASQIVAENAVTDFEELLDPDAVARLGAMARHLRPVATADSEPHDDTDWDSDY